MVVPFEADSLHGEVVEVVPYTVEKALSTAISTRSLLE